MIEEAFGLMVGNPLPGCVCEFGVWQGAGLEVMARMIQEKLPTPIPLYGFDSFAGMPKTEVALADNHAIVWAAGGYVANIQEVNKRVPSSLLVKGEFKCLMPLYRYGVTHVRFARIDCDIYEGYRDALKLLTPHVYVGTLLLFDEGVAPDDPLYHDSIRDSGERAIREWQEESGFKLRVIHTQGTECLTVIEAKR